MDRTLKQKPSSPYLAMGNNPISFIDPDGGRAILTPYQKEKLLANLFFHRQEYTKREYLQNWLSITGKESYRGLTLEGLDAAVRQFGLDGYNGYLNGFEEMCKDGRGNELYAPSGSKNFQEGNYIDGLKVGNFAFELFVANTLRESILTASTNIEGMSNSAIMHMFGSGETNWDRTKRERREDAAEKTTHGTEKEKKKTEAIEALIKVITSFVFSNNSNAGAININNPQQSGGNVYASVDGVINGSTQNVYILKEDETSVTVLKPGEPYDAPIEGFSTGDVTVKVYGNNLGFDITIEGPGQYSGARPFMTKEVDFDFIQQKTFQPNGTYQTLGQRKDGFWIKDTKWRDLWYKKVTDW